ncbi:GNAT family N-acetyltransferase [Sabulilitoribacter arenilitoris]|uniref:GNAT family N-acetyltransferase n=1 Tax=Wocania arenilitoris TaxID=2044858 RepID=A0AAE3JLH9_9FLAO|nr:GNAT family N-acetyltransferase [Wocania arenilitoris]MCF7568299.1 GNAT family N-acetyltransferase [Wocania arenilitoris]
MHNSLIINALLKWCKTKNINEIRLDVYENNPSAIKAYKKAGFKNI